MHVRELAEDETGTWRIVFVPDEMHLWVEYKRHERGSADQMTIEDFLVSIPRSACQQRALNNLTALIVVGLSVCDDPEPSDDGNLPA